MIRVAVNGFGRIGKMFVRALLSDPEAQKSVQLVAINAGHADPKMVPYALKYDSVYGQFAGSYLYRDGNLEGEGRVISIMTETDPQKLAWNNIDWVVDATGKFTKRASAEQHLRAGAGSVLITAPSPDADATIICGVNEDDYRPTHVIVSLGSCTTNAVVPLIYHLHKAYRITAATMTTTHAYTNSQALLDGVGPSDDWERSRAAALNIVPSKTGALETVQQIIPELKGRLTGHALRVPVPTVSIIDLVVMIEKSVSRDMVHELFRKASLDRPDIVGIAEPALVSSDLRGDMRSVIVDRAMTYSTGNLVKVTGWYDNEVGYSERLKDFLVQRARA